MVIDTKKLEGFLNILETASNRDRELYEMIAFELQEAAAKGDAKAILNVLAEVRTGLTEDKDLRKFGAFRVEIRRACKRNQIKSLRPVFDAIKYRLRAQSVKDAKRLKAFTEQIETSNKSELTLG
jgi:nucleoid DNA-binding protein